MSFPTPDCDGVIRALGLGTLPESAGAVYTLAADLPVAAGVATPVLGMTNPYDFPRSLRSFWNVIDIIQITVLMGAAAGAVELANANGGYSVCQIPANSYGTIIASNFGVAPAGFPGYQTQGLVKCSQAFTIKRFGVSAEFAGNVASWHAVYAYWR